MNKHEDLDLAILSLLLKSHSGGDEAHRITQLKLALMWDRVDIAQEEIFREDVLWKQGMTTQYYSGSKVGLHNITLETR